MNSEISFTSGVVNDLSALGQQIRGNRKALRISATTLAEAADISRVTLYRIEKGEPTVTMGAYLSVLAALGLRFGLVAPTESTAVRQGTGRAGWIPARIRLADYPQLARLAWQVQGTETLAPKEAWDIYERNWRHVDESALAQPERELIDALRLVFGGGVARV